MKKKNFSLIAIVFITASSIVLTITVCLTWGIFLEKLTAEIPTFFNKEVYLKREISLEKEQVKDALNTIQLTRKESWKNLKLTLKNRDYIAWNIVNNIYKKYSSRLDLKQIKERIIDALSNQILDKGTGYYFITSLNGEEILSPQTELMGKNLLKDKRYSKSVLQEIEVVKKLKEGFVEGTFLNNGKKMKRIVYAKLFKPLNWYVGCGKLIPVYNKEVKNLVLKHIEASFRYTNNPNLFVVQLNPEDKQCLSNVILYTDPAFDNHTCIQKDAKFITDLEGKPCLQKYLKELLQKGQLQTTLIWPFHKKKIEQKRITYLYFYKPYNWVIGSCAPINFESFFPAFTTYLKKRFFKFSLEISLASLAASLFVGLSLWFILFLRLFYKPLKMDIDKLNEFFKTYPKTTYIDTNAIEIDELEKLSNSINKLINNIQEKNNKIKELADKYESLAKNIPETLLIFEKKNDSFILEDFNQQKGKIFKQLKQDLNIEEIFSNESLMKALNTVYKHGFTIQLIAKENDSYLLFRIYKIFGDRVVCLIRDITNTVKVYRAIERNRNIMSTMLNSIKTGILVINNKGKIAFVNSFAKEILGIKHSQEMFDKIKLPHSIKYKFIKVLHNRDKCEGCEFNLTTALGQSKWFSVYATPMQLGSKTMVIVSFNDITQKHLKSKQLEYLSFHDTLTGLYNRRYFEEEFSRLFNRRHYPLGLILVDLNGLKIVNDILGHKMGDKLIIKTAEILATSTRASDIVARIGGDEFAILAPKTNESGIKKILERIRIKIETENTTGELLVSISYGYSIQTGQFKDSEEFFKDADINLYKNKYSENRRNTLLSITRWANSISSKNHRIDDPYFIDRTGNIKET